MKTTIAALLLATMTATTALAGAGHGDDMRAYGEPGSPGHAARTIRIEMRETDDGMAFNPSKLLVRKGEQIRFVITNIGEIDHEMVVGTVEENLAHGQQMAMHPDMEHDDPNAIRLTPNAKGEIIWKFSNAGEFDFSCLIPGHREGGMFGTIIVK